MALTTESPSALQSEVGQAPQVSRWMLNAFHMYLQRYFRRHFHSVCVSFECRLEAGPDVPLVAYVNHASWWDPLLGLILQRAVFPEHTLFAPIDATALQRYRILARLGFFGVEQDQKRGAASFLRASRSILKQQGASIWLTPEGRFADPRDHAAEFQPGLAHLASRLDDGVIVPIAIELPFWEERLPEALARFGRPLHVRQYRDYSKDDWTEVLQNRLRKTQRNLAELSLERRADAFEILISGRSGVGLVYDLGRRCKSLLFGQRFQADHGEKLQ